MNRETRKESSIPVQARVSIVDLAKMDLYWRRVENTHIKTMSQLVSWTFSAMVEVIEANEKMPKDIDSVLAAHKHLEARELYQSSMRKRSGSRIGAALQMESLRNQGSDPQLHASKQFNTIHSEHSIETLDGQVNTGKIDWDEVDKKLAEETRENALDAAEASGAIFNEEEFHDGLRERDKEIIEKENAPVDETDFDLAEE